VPNGPKMFEIARKALEDMAQFIHSYQKVVLNPNKFCHGYGIFQYDLQFFEKTDPDYFLERRYTNFDECLKKAIGELRSATKKIHLQDKPALSDLEMAFVAVAYNTGGFNPAKGLKQGFKSDDGKFYGEQIFAFMEQSKTVPVDEPVPAQPASSESVGPRFEVTSADPLRLRGKPSKDQDNPNANVTARLPNGQVVRAITNEEVNGFLEVETDLEGKHLRGFASAQFLKLI
jgi:hypothetical protein